MRGPGRKRGRPGDRRIRRGDTPPEVPVRVADTPTPGKLADAVVEGQAAPASDAMDDKIRRMIEAAYT
ncbi:MAG TPA: hypothetical protein VGG99_05795 [Acetobacteraceae bacterium]|jgi:hypothetical protein